MNENSSTDELTISDLHGVLAVERRRLVLDILTGIITTVELKELAMVIAEREDGIDAADGEIIERVTIGLHHNHLPRLDDAGLIGYDPDSHTVNPTNLRKYQLDDCITFTSEGE